MSGEVKACGKRGLVIWCSHCKAWEPLDLEREVPIDTADPRIVRHEKQRGAWCRTCGHQLEEIRPYAEDADAVPDDEEHDDGTVARAQRDLEREGYWDVPPKPGSGGTPSG